MLVEDDADLREALKDELEYGGFDVRCASDGQVALETLQRWKPDLIALDLYLPRVDGWEFRVRQRRDPRLAAIPVVAMSADPSARAAAVDSDAFIRKPFTGAKLRAVIDCVLSGADQQQLRSDRLTACERLATLGTLAGGIAHEINNPLAVVLSSLDLLGMDLETLVAKAGPSVDVSDLDEDVRTARAAVEQIRGIVADFYLASKPPDDDRLGPIPIAKVVDNCVKVAWSQIRGKASLVKQLADIPPAAGSDGRVMQVLLTLLLNAAQALPEDGAAHNEIRIVTRTHGDSAVEIEIHDNGPGMTNDTLARLFQPFFTTKPPGLGTGLGLFVARQICRDLGGDLLAGSGPQQGSTFTVILPTHPRPTNA